jgi:hypothetical protein
MERVQNGQKEGKVEQASRILRNLNAVGAVALGGAAVLFPAAATPLYALAALNVAQAGGFELARQYTKRKRLGPQSTRQHPSFSISRAFGRA